MLNAAGSHIRVYGVWAVTVPPSPPAAVVGVVAEAGAAAVGVVAEEVRPEEEAQSPVGLAELEVRASVKGMRSSGLTWNVPRLKLARSGSPAQVSPLRRPVSWFSWARELVPCQ